MNIKPCHPYAAIRLTEGNHWIDTGTISFDPQEAMRIALETNENLSACNWAKLNPIIEVVRVNITPLPRI